MEGNLLDCQAEALVNTVNTVGHMGKGLALQFKKRFKENHAAYVAACEAKRLAPGDLLIFECGTLTNPRFIINAATKKHWRGRSRIEYIQSILSRLTEEIQDRGIRSIAVPALGCGYGGLDWPDVRAEIEKSLGPIPNTDVIVFGPSASK